MENGGKVNGIEVLSQWLYGRVPLAFLYPVSGMLLIG